MYILPDTVKLVIRPTVFIPQTSVSYLKNSIRNTFNVSAKESEKGVSFKLNETTFFLKVVDNSLWIKFNLIRKVTERLERNGFYKRDRGYGECYNFINPDFLNIELSTAINEAYHLFTEEITFAKDIFHSIILSAFELDLLPMQSTCRLFWVDLAGDFLNENAPDKIETLHFGFKMNQDLQYSYEDEQLRGICAHNRKRDGKAGDKLFRMYLKTNRIIRYESYLDKKTAGDSFPRMDLSSLNGEGLKNCIAPLENRLIESFTQVEKDSAMKELLSTEPSRYELLKRILNILDGNIGKGNTLHIGNLIEKGYVQSRVVQDYRLLRLLRERKVILPAHQFQSRQRPGQYRLNREFLSEHKEIQKQE